MKRKWRENEEMQGNGERTRSLSALRDDGAVYWVSIEHSEVRFVHAVTAGGCVKFLPLM